MNPERANTAVIRAKKSDGAEAFVQTAFLKVVTFVGTYKGVAGGGWVAAKCVARFNMSKFQGKLTLGGKPVDHVSASLEMSSVVLIGPLFFPPRPSVHDQCLVTH